MCGGGNIFKAVLPALGAIGGSILLPGIGTALGANIGGLATAGGALGGLAGGYAGGARGSGLLLDTVGGGIAPNAGDILSGIGSGLESGANSIGGIFGDSTLGTDLANFNPSTGLSQLFGGTSAPSSDLTGAYNSINSAAPDAATTAGATSPIDFAPGGASASYTAGAAAPGSAGVGGGVLPSGIGEDISVGSAQGGAPLGAGIGAAPPSGISSLFSSPANTFNYDINGLPAGASSYSIPQQFAQSAAPAATGGSVSGLSSLFGGNSNMTNGLVKAGLGALLNNNNASGQKAIMNAANTAAANYQPYYAAGTQAENTLADLYGNNGSAAQTAAMQNFQNTPGYQFSLNQGLNALNANNAAMGQTLSGNALEGINNYAQGVASQQYNNYINQLQNLASGGMSAAGGMGTAGLTGAAARAQLGQNNANNMNTAIGTGLSALFPTQMDITKLLPYLQGGNSGGLLSMF